MKIHNVKMCCDTV